MKNEVFNPYIRFANVVNIRQPYSTMIVAYDFRLFYVAKGMFDIEFEDRYITIEEGDMIIIPPSVAYRLKYYADMPIRYYILNFDFDGCFEQHTPRPPVPKERFDKRDVFSAWSFEPYDDIFILHNTYIAEEILEELYNYYKEQSYNAIHLQSALLKYLLAKAIVLNEKNQRCISSAEEKTINGIKKYVKQNVAEPITNQDVARHFGYHPHYLNTMFVNSEGITLHKYIEKSKLDVAKDLLIHSDCSINIIAHRCGFNDASYFCRFFARHMSITPAKYRNTTK